MGGEIIAVFYAGWNLAAAALGAINALAERARVGTSAAHDKLKHKNQTKNSDARQQLFPWEAGWSPQTDLEWLCSLWACCHPALAFHLMSHCHVFPALLSCKPTLFLEGHAPDVFCFFLSTSGSCLRAGFKGTELMVDWSYKLFTSFELNKKYQVRWVPEHCWSVIIQKSFVKLRRSTTVVQLLRQKW